MPGGGTGLMPGATSLRAASGWLTLAVIMLLAAILLVWRSAGWKHDGRHENTLLPGLTIESALTPNAGLIVTSLQEDSEAANAGIGVGDEIRSVDGHPMRRLADARAYLRKAPHPVIAIHVTRGNAGRDVRLHRSEDRHGA